MSDDRKELRDDELDKVNGGSKGDKESKYCYKCLRNTTFTSRGFKYITVKSTGERTFSVQWRCDTCSSQYYIELSTNNIFFPEDVE